jgi:hypothetical protein
VSVKLLGPLFVCLFFFFDGFCFLCQLNCSDLCVFFFFFFLMGFVFLVDCRGGGRILQWVLFSWSIVAVGEEFCSCMRLSVCSDSPTTFISFSGET